MQDLTDHIQTRLKELPARPGVYLMKGSSGKIIYIGKAVNLRNRVRSYFTGTNTAFHYAAGILSEKAAEIEWIITENEKEALILEANLIRKHTPRYNIDLKDDKHFPYLKLTLSEPFPRITVIRSVKKGGKDLFFGPFTDSRAMRRTMEIIYKVFRIRDCKLSLPLKNPIRPCLTHHIGRCDAPCAGLCTAAEYGRLVEEVMLLLGGKSRELLDRLKSEMAAQAQNRNYEQAARARDQIHDLETVLEKQKMDLGKDQAPRDLVVVTREGKIGCALIMQIRDGLVLDKKCYELTCPLDQDSNALITDFLKKVYQDGSLIPREIIVSHPPVADEHLPSLLSELRGGPVSITLPRKGFRRRQVELALANARMSAAEFLARHEKKNRMHHAVAALQEDLKLSSPPRHIEAFDISHLSGTDIVASMVVFTDGQPNKGDYRKYNIKDVPDSDDTACIHEVVFRRISRLLNENKPLPDLILIDGGKGQLNAALKALEENGVRDQNIIGLAKQFEEIFLPGISSPVIIPRTSASLKLLQQVRDEAHRFAITFQRSKRKKHLTTTWLDNVPGIGPKMKERLLKTFRSAAKARSATAEELSACIGPKLAERIGKYV